MTEYYRPVTRGELLRKLQEGVACETPTFGAEMSSIMLRGWPQFDKFTTRPSENEGYTVFEPVKQTCPACNAPTQENDWYAFTRASHS